MTITFGTRLKQLRAASGQKQDVLAAESGLGQSTISRLQSDSGDPTPEQVQKLARALGVSPRALVGGTKLAETLPSELLVTLTPGDGVKWLGYFASGLTNLDKAQRGTLDADAASARKACEDIRAYLYEPAHYTDPVLHKDLSPEDVYAIDNAQVSRSNFVILDARFPSFGAGQEIEIATHAGLPIVILAPKGVAVSRMVLGTFAKTYVVEFASPADLDRRLSAVFTELVAHLTPLKRPERIADLGTVTDDANTFGGRLRRTITSMRLDHATLARTVGLSVRALQELERPGANPSLTILQRLAASLRTTVAFLVEGVAGTPEDLDPVLRKSKDNLTEYAQTNGVALLEAERVWNTYFARYQVERHSVAEARTEAVTGKEWALKVAQERAAHSSNPQLGMLGD